MCVYSKLVNYLELSKILNQLSSFAIYKETKNLILKIEPSHNLNIVQNKIDEVDEAMSFLQRGEYFEFLEIENPVNSIKLATLGITLNQQALLNIGLILKQTRLILNKFEQNKSLFIKLKPVFSKLNSLNDLEIKILNSIISIDFIADDASDNLKLIRSEIVKKRKKINDLLNNYLTGSKKIYLQDSIISLKNGRYVLAVKSQYVKQIPGLVQEISASGSTVFVEPNDVIDSCNELKILVSKEKQEIDLILTNLTLDCLQNSNLIEKNYENLLNIDLIFSKANFAIDGGCVKPKKINDIGEINLIQARHPLIDKNKVVPIDVALGGTFKNLIISGPNTGGKTVALKTIGLISLMLMCGLLVPCSENSSISIFKQILVLIGDKQSIENSLSTFSAHIKNLVDILNKVNEKSLVLIDEICSGTDPDQGASLAISIIERLIQKRACFAITTHFTKLKFHFFKNESVKNASFEFDEKLLQPTYKLSIGTFGQSNAFQIAKKLGIQIDILTRAENLLSKQQIDFYKIIDRLNKIKLKYEHELKKQVEKMEQIRILQKEVEQEKNNLKLNADIYLNKAKLKADSVLKIINNEASTIFNELKIIKKFMSNQHIERTLEKAKSILKNSTTKLMEKYDFKVDDENKIVTYNLPRQLKIGDLVQIIDLNKQAKILSEVDKKNRVLVEFGNLQTRINVDKLKLVSSNNDVNKTNLKIQKNLNKKKDRKVETSVDVRGCNSEDAIFIVDRAIDNAVLNHLSILTIIHGKGTGVLRKNIYQHLKKHKNIRTQRLGDYFEGGDGVTIVELK